MVKNKKMGYSFKSFALVYIIIKFPKNILHGNESDCSSSGVLIQFRVISIMGRCSIKKTVIREKPVLDFLTFQNGD